MAREVAKRQQTRSTPHEAVNRKRRLYLASPAGFSPGPRVGGARGFLRCILTSLGAEVWEPFAEGGTMDRSLPQWAWQVGQAHAKGVRWADGLFAVVNGCPPDEGVMIEIGIALGLRKPVFFFRDDFRRCGGDGDYPLNLMLFTGCSDRGWRDFWYTAVGDLGDPERGLVRWLRGEDVEGAVEEMPDYDFDDGIPF